MEVAGKSSENVFTIKRVRAIIKNETNRQSRNMCVKCHTDGELPVDEKSILAVHILHPAAALDREQNTCCAWQKDYCKGGIFLWKNVRNYETCSGNHFRS